MLRNSTNSFFLLAIAALVLFVVGCEASTPTDANTAANNAEVTLSEDVLSWIEKGSKAGAVKAHQKETGLSLAEAKEQVEFVMERDGLKLGAQ
jgi:ribosomal protein L7/L12